MYLWIDKERETVKFQLIYFIPFPHSWTQTFHIEPNTKTNTNITFTLNTHLIWTSQLNNHNNSGTSTVFVETNRTAPQRLLDTESPLFVSVSHGNAPPEPAPGPSVLRSASPSMSARQGPLRHARSLPGPQGGNKESQVPTRAPGG